MKEQLPTHSRMTPNAADWFKSYDINYSGPLKPSQVEEYYQNGFVIVNDLIPLDYLKECKKDISRMVDALAYNLQKASLINDPCDDPNKYNVTNRLIELEKQYPGSSVLLHVYGNILQPSFINLWESKELSDIAFQLLQPEASNPAIDAHPVWNLRCKCPSNEQSTVPWHQDVSYLQPAAWHVKYSLLWFIDVHLSYIFFLKSVQVQKTLSVTLNDVN